MGSTASQFDMFQNNTEPSEVEEDLSWKSVLKEEKSKDYFKNILSFIDSERKAGKTIYPANNNIFNALSLTELSDVKVVILGQDPYHGPKQAHGLCFSVQKSVPAPPSLVNIFKEIESDLGIARPNHGCLEHWAKQGVLLLNTVLSVERGKAHSHADIGWERFTDKVISCVNKSRSNVVFLLWGAHAQKKGALINREKHHVLTAPHPSPLSAHRGFLGCKHFSIANDLLAKNGLEPIDWRLADA